MREGNRDSYGENATPSGNAHIHHAIIFFFFLNFTIRAEVSGADKSVPASSDLVYILIRLMIPFLCRGIFLRSYLIPLIDDVLLNNSSRLHGKINHLIASGRPSVGTDPIMHLSL